MIRSMTGYGRAQQTIDGREIVAEIRAVNNRFLDCTVKLPRAYSFAEDPVKQLVKREVGRGKVDVFLTINAFESDDVAITLNRPVVEGYLAAMREMVADYGVQDDISAAVLSRLPDVFTVQKAEQDEEKLTAALVAVTEAAIAAFNTMRQTEGDALARDVLGRADRILSLVEQVEKRSPETVAEYRAKLYARMQETLQNTTIDEARILTEAAIFADKVAADEETVRLRSHIDQLRAMFAGGGAIGRKLDFLIQEFNREANTIGSKASDVEQARTVVEIKGEIEKIREQIQNIE